MLGNNDYGWTPNKAKREAALPAPTGSALDIIEAMRAQGYVVQLDNGLDGTWEAQFYKPTKPEGLKSYGAGSTMLDAVKAATKTVAACENCMNWEVPEPPNKRTGLGYCAVFDKQTHAKHGNQCTAFDPWPDAYTPNNKVSDGGPLTHEYKQDANPPFAAPIG